MRPAFRPKPHPYDALRDSLKANGNSVFGAPVMLVPATNTWGSLVPWSGSSPVTMYKSKKMGFPGARYVLVTYDSGHVVNVPDESDEEVARLATVFMDLINSQYQS